MISLRTILQYNLKYFLGLLSQETHTMEIQNSLCDSENEDMASFWIPVPENHIEIELASVPDPIEDWTIDPQIDEFLEHSENVSIETATERFIK